ncbi:von Willebrand factor binding protein Vwb [Staphylococcus aureus]|uniref:von Willebrand factor binding protein Vwb n=1 Tax=Staphylococcus aureus TaxID=1280 RepID=UPI00139B1A30|nr:von Willebrand factor binding protein Vwb [Staphylococcus aureus]NDP54576.1 von Willebrand factor binding protein Vwb [Staphylococcus aureus]NDQ33021.1 von Willebrand factor binding protein Vwb [Staphylococcus aureus]NDQ43477.1 von Willebrand factor binding protein Vwb [Staphylococcus aureus]
MKKKVLILTLGALCASQLWNSDNASAIVTGEKNPYTSKAIGMKNNSNKSLTVERYEKSLKDLILSLSIGNVEKYYELEYKDALNKYQQKYMAEDEALLRFFNEEKKLKNGNKSSNGHNLLGLTHERYRSVFDALKENKNDFLKEVEEINNKNPELKEFDNEEQTKADIELNTLENQILMIGHTFYSSNKIEVEDLYNKLDMILGYSDEERKSKKVINKRMLDNKKEDLETIIDEFFEDIGTHRPNNIPVLASKKDGELNLRNKTQLKIDAEIAKSDISKRSKRSLDKQKHNSLSEEVSEEQKVKYNKEMEEIKEKFLAKSKLRNPVASLIDDEDDNGKRKQLIISTPTNKPIAPPTYTETTTQVPMPVLERQTQQQIIYNAPKQLAGLNGESHDFTTTHQSPTTSNHTHNHLIEFEESSALPGRKSGSLVGISQIDSSHLTEREKRVIKREHVREAQKLVDNYKDTHSYNDCVKAQQKVNTLGEAHKNYFNKQINKVYNGK